MVLSVVCYIFSVVSHPSTPPDGAVPEKVPFRLTRVMIQAMEVSGIEGTFRVTCEAVMQVLRDNKESLLAVLEAFVHDPLVSRRR